MHEAERLRFLRREALGGDVHAPSVEVDTFGYDVGIFALLGVGFGVLFMNLALGGLLIAASPVLAVYLKGKVEVETKKRAKELAPEALRQAATRIGPKLDEMIQEFAQRLDTWVVTAGEELHREVIEILESARSERSLHGATAESATTLCDTEAKDLTGIVEHLETLRKSLWATPAAS